MKYNSISGLLTAIADEIRAKDGSSELINPQDLPERIASLPAGEEYGIYLKILDTDTAISYDYSDALTANSPEVTEFFSDAFDWLPIIRENWHTAYQCDLIHEYYTILAYEAQKKKMGLPNVYDSLPVKRIPILAVKTKASYYENGDLMRPEQILILGNIYDERSTGEGFYCDVFSRSNTIGLDEQSNSSIVVNIKDEGIRIVEID